MDATKFGAFVAEVRKEHNMTQADLANKIQVTDKAVSRWERGLGFPDINSLEPLAEALGVSVLELMKSERIEESNIQCGDAVTIVSDTLKAAELQRQEERKQEVKIILGSLGLITILSIFVLLIDSIGWSIQNVIFTSFGVVFPVISLFTFLVLLVVGITRRISGKSSKRVLLTALVFGLLLIGLFLLFFIGGLFAFPGQS